MASRQHGLFGGKRGTSRGSTTQCRRASRGPKPMRLISSGCAVRCSRGKAESNERLALPSRCPCLGRHGPFVVRNGRGAPSRCWIEAGAFDSIPRSLLGRLPAPSLLMPSSPPPCGPRVSMLPAGVGCCLTLNEGRLFHPPCLEVCCCALWRVTSFGRLLRRTIPSTWQSAPTACPLAWRGTASYEQGFPGLRRGGLVVAGLGQWAEGRPSCGVMPVSAVVRLTDGRVDPQPCQGSRLATELETLSPSTSGTGSVLRVSAV